MTKRYYWLKLNEDFFEDDTIQWIEDQEGGDRYLLFYLKLCLKSIKDDGNLIRYVGEKLIPYDVKALAKLTNTDKDTVAVALKAFEEIGLIQTKSTGEIYMKQIDEMIGTETDTAKRVRRHRAKQKALEETNQMLQCNAALLQSNTVETKSNTEIEIEIEKELEVEIEVEQEEAPSNHFEYIKNTWNKLNEPITNIMTLNSGTNRHNMTKARIAEYGIDTVVNAIKSINDSEFLKGNNDRGWIITYDWFIKPNNFLKVAEGNYQDHNQNSKTNEYHNLLDNWANEGE